MPGRPGALPPRHDDDGLSLVEVIVALFIVAVVMTSSALFFINGLKNSGLQTQRQTAATLANQALEAVQAARPDTVLGGRTQADVDALGPLPDGRPLPEGDLSTGNIDTAASALNGPADDVVPANPAPTTIAGVAYRIRTFIDRCYVNAGTNGQVCTVTTNSKGILLRATVLVTWTPGTASCQGGCRYSASALLDTQADPEFNTNKSEPVIDNVTPSSARVGTTQKLTISGKSFVAGATVSIAAGGGTMSPVASNTGVQIVVDWTVGAAAGPFDLYVTNPDGGQAKYTMTAVPQPVITGINPSPIQNGVGTAVTLTGTGFQPNAQITMTNGTATSASFGSSMSITVTLTPNGTAASSTTVTVTNPDGGSASRSVPLSVSKPTISSFSQGTVNYVNAPTTITLTGSGFAAGAGVSASTGAVSNLSVTATTASFTFTPTAANASTTFTLTNPDSGAVATSKVVNTLAARPVITNMTRTFPKNTSPASFTLTGTNFSTPASVTVSGSGYGTTGTVASSSSTATNITFSTAVPGGNTNTYVTVTVRFTDGQTASFSTTVTS